MKYNREVGVLVKWEYWYRSEDDIKNGIQNDPICRKRRVSTIDDAYCLAEALIIHHEKNLRIVDISVRLYPEGV